jgi:TetR/AcrR family transcriptional repressor of nem operon
VADGRQRRGALLLRIRSMRSAVNALAHLASRGVAGSVEHRRKVHGRGDSGMDPAGRPCPYRVLRIVVDLCMMSVMQRPRLSARAAAKEATHERIVGVAARAIRRSGYGGTGVADIMKEAGLTHGGFYAHFPSREAMLAEAARRACAESAASVAEVVASAPTGQALASVLGAYLSKEHLERVEVGCPLAALGSETSRQVPEVRRVATRHIKEMIDLIARQAPDWGQPAAHERAMVTIATMVGALMLSRAVDEPGLSDGLREAALKSLTPAGY